MSPAPPGTVALAVTELGAGPAVVILHGLLGSSRNWHSIGKALAEDRKVILADLRNHGGSPWADAMDYPAMAADVARLIRERAGGRAAVVGHSMGGKVAMVLALTEPGIVDRLGVVDIAPVAYRNSTFLGYIEAMRAIDPTGLARRGDAEAALTAVAPDPGVRSFLLQNLAFGADGAAWKPNLAVLARTLPEIVGFPRLEARYDGPTLVIRGARSDYVADGFLPALRRLFPQAAIETVAEAGHWVHAERQAEVTGLLRRFLAA